ncbi:MAG: hypothetical protein EOM90_07815 [Alphaproteobacteria bacterium]|nr:hypothetical protein [Alphaproteobacteria bacterium]
MKITHEKHTRQMIRIRNGLLFLCFLIFILTALFPPWDAVVDPFGDIRKVPVGYHFFATPPHSPYGFESYILINYSRILIQWGILFLVSLGIYKVLNAKIRKLNTESE